MRNKKRSFFERLTGSIRMEDDEAANGGEEYTEKEEGGNGWMEEENDEAELTVDVYQTEEEIIIQTMVAGVKPDDIDLDITREMMKISGKRENNKNIDDENYFTQELYWGKFSRTILLPAEIEPEEAEATEKHGLLTIKLQKVDKEKRRSLKVKSI